jgi:hypothetical protein
MELQEVGNWGAWIIITAMWYLYWELVQTREVDG